MINRILEVEDVEDVACTVDDMEATDRSRSFVQWGLCEGRGHKSTRVDRMDSDMLEAQGRLWRLSRHYGHATRSDQAY